MTCCGQNECKYYAEDLQNYQHKCNVIFGKYHDLDEKGNTKGTLCEELQNKKIRIMNDNYHDKNCARSLCNKLGGKKLNKRKTKKRKTKKRKIRKHKTKKRKTRKY